MISNGINVRADICSISILCIVYRKKSEESNDGRNRDTEMKKLSHEML